MMTSGTSTSGAAWNHATIGAVTTSIAAANTAIPTCTRSVARSASWSFFTRRRDRPAHALRRTRDDHVVEDVGDREDAREGAVIG